mmetsp:Transcript_5886/g.19484  ORF Transcript_5886/g.19484 Transcript_5886/m.19484 type:complete len:519 (-) Transcript_5886:248-1804(-)
MARQTGDERLLGRGPHARGAVGGSEALELLVVHRRDGEDRQIEARHQRIRVGRTRLRGHLPQPGMKVLLEPLHCELVARLGALEQAGARRQPKRPHSLGAVEDVGLRRNECERSELAVHQQLPTEVLPQHVTGRLVVDRPHNIGDDPDGVGVLELALDHRVARRVVVVHARRVDQHTARREHRPVPRPHPHLLDDGPIVAAKALGSAETVGRAAAPAVDQVGRRVHVALELPPEGPRVRRRHRLDGAERGGDGARRDELGAQLLHRRVFVDGPVLRPLLARGHAGVLEDVSIRGVQPAPRTIRWAVGLDLSDSDAAGVGPVGGRQVVQQLVQLLVPLRLRQKLHLASVRGCRWRGVLVSQLDQGRRARAHAVGGEHGGLVEQGVEQRGLARACVAHHHDRHARQLARLPVRLKLGEERGPHIRVGPRVVLAQVGRELVAAPFDQAEGVALILELGLAHLAVKFAVASRRGGCLSTSRCAGARISGGGVRCRPDAGNGRIGIQRRGRRRRRPGRKRIHQ